MATSLGKVGIVDKGNYSSKEIYNSGDFVFYEGSTWLALKDNLLGVEPGEGENWKYLARGVPKNIQDEIDSIKNNKLDKTEFDNLTIGGRNLALGTSNKYESVKLSPNIENISTPLNKVINDGLSIGDTMMIRMIVKCTNIVPTEGKEAVFRIAGTGNISNWGVGSLSGSHIYGIKGSGEIEVLHKITITKDHLKNSYWALQFAHSWIASGTIEIKNVKVENSTKPTDWTPAPEDIANEIKAIADDTTATLLTNEGFNKRPTDANIEIGKYKGISTMLASSSMTSNKPDGINAANNDGVILNLGWDTGANYGSQIAIGNNSNPHMAIRGSHEHNGWDEKWTHILDENNFKEYVTPLSIGAVNKPTQKSLTIPNVGWVDEVHGSYLKKLVLSVEGITENMIVNLNIALESDEVAVNCGFASINESGNGTLTFYAESVPGDNINATYYVLN